MSLNTSFEIVVLSTLEEHCHEEDPEFTTKENYHWTAQQEKVPHSFSWYRNAPTLHPSTSKPCKIWFKRPSLLIVTNQSRLWLNPWWPTWRTPWSWRSWGGSTWSMEVGAFPAFCRSPSHIYQLLEILYFDLDLILFLSGFPFLISIYIHLHPVSRLPGRKSTWSKH